MARPKRPPHPLLKVAHEYVATNAPELEDADLFLRQLDGPPEAPRFAVSVISCQREHECPYHVDETDTENCPIISCELRAALRLLYSRDGTLMKVSRSTIRWNSQTPTAELE